MYNAALIPETVSLRHRTTIGIGGLSSRFYEPRSAEDACLILSRFRQNGEEPFVLGGGSNILVCSDPVERPIISTRRLTTLEVDGDSIYAASGVMLPYLVRVCAEHGLSGMEGLSGIPASIGGAVAMNAGTKHRSIGELVTAVEVADAEGRPYLKQKGELLFAYRSGPVKEGEVVLGVWLKLKESDSDAVSALTRRLLREKVATQPLEMRSAGCVFKNPPSESAGYLIDRVGLKGYRRGDAEFSPKHANFIVNRGNATSEDVLALIELAKKRVRESFGVELQLEIRLL